MTDGKWIWPVILLIGGGYFIWNYDVEDYPWEIFIVVCIICIYSAIRLYYSYTKGMKDFEEVSLYAKEKWDFLYQDSWVPGLIIFTCICLLLISLDDASAVIYMQLPLLLKILFDKLILRNKLIVDEHKIAFS